MENKRQQKHKRKVSDANLPPGEEDDVGLADPMQQAKEEFEFVSERRPNVIGNADQFMYEDGQEEQKEEAN